MKHLAACPLCGTIDDVVHAEYTLGHRHLVEAPDEKSVTFSGLTRYIYDMEKDATLYCEKCDHDFPIPEGLDIDWD